LRPVFDLTNNEVHYLPQRHAVNVGPLTGNEAYIRIAGTTRGVLLEAVQHPESPVSGEGWNYFSPEEPGLRILERN
jgi:hypothetical protein